MAGDIFGHRLTGPECPICYRNDGTHAMGCGVESYVAAWDRIRIDETQRLADSFVSDQEEASWPGEKKFMQM